MNASAANAETLLRQAGSPLGTGRARLGAGGWGGCNQSTYCREYAFFPKVSARPSRDASTRFRDDAP